MTTPLCSAFRETDFGLNRPPAPPTKPDPDVSLRNWLYRTGAVTLPDADDQLLEVRFVGIDVPLCADGANRAYRLDLLGLTADGRLVGLDVRTGKRPAAWAVLVPWIGQLTDALKVLKPALEAEISGFRPNQSFADDAPLAVLVGLEALWGPILPPPDPALPLYQLIRPDDPAAPVVLTRL